MIPGMGYDITIRFYRHIWCDITPDHPKTQGKNNVHENPPPCCSLLFVSALLVSAPFLPGLRSGLFCRPSVVHQLDNRIDRTTSEHQPCSLNTFLFHFVSFLLSLSLFLLVTWYSLVVTRYLEYCFCSWALFLVQYHFVVEIRSGCSLFYI